MRKYEGMFIVRPTLDEDGYKALIADIEKIFSEHNSKVTEINIWGMRDMAYEIDDLKKGYYVAFKVEATSEAVLEYDRICNIREEILRHILVKEQ
ncbi:MAG: 30S ribosomal protein S6 [Bacilli bacterium]|nr:30S ribosomal protein S6 [Bacilli bacterium]MDD4076894.1 30S ribosomal protein S6 [Bacilli bacterium]MDD4388594.1 30S ribosomal protein S6 [Bacilli bacterium]